MTNLDQIKKDLTAAAKDKSDSSPFLIFTINNLLLAINCGYVAAIEESGVITKTANTSKNSDVKGISYYKNEAVNIIDLRSVFGYSSQLVQLEQQTNLPARINDHTRYVEELEKCAASGTEFTLTGDPHECKFGKWYYEFRNKNKSVALASLLAKIEEPHENVHRYADIVNSYIRNGDIENAVKSAAEVRGNYYGEVVRYIEAINAYLHENTKDLVIIANVNNKKIGFLVDTVESVDSITDIQPLPAATAVSSHIRNLGLLRNDLKNAPDIVLIAEAESFI